jgi:AcrR family transcriptional regulator
VDRTEEAIQKAAEATERALERAHRQVERAEADAARQLERARERSRSRGEEEADDPIWLRPEPGVRSARFSRDQIAAQALEIADRDGLDAVSMRRVAAELGAGTMTLYHYVRNKQELLDLVHDAMMGELLVDPAKLEGDWREALTALADAAYQTWVQHSWVSHAMPSRPYFGPNAIRHFEQSLQAAATTGLPMEQRLEVVNQVDDYVGGYVSRERALVSDEGPEVSKQAFDELVGPFSHYIEMELGRGDYPRIREFVGDERVGEVVWRIIQASDPRERYERGLKRLLDGVQAEIDRAAG